MGSLVVSVLRNRSLHLSCCEKAIRTMAVVNEKACSFVQAIEFKLLQFLKYLSSKSIDNQIWQLLIAVNNRLGRVENPI